MTSTATRNPPVVELLKQELYQRLGRDWRAGERLPNVTELARLLGAGQRNTHLAVKALAEEGLLVARQGSGTYVARDLDSRAVHEQASESPYAPTLVHGRLTGLTVALVTSEHLGSDTTMQTALRQAQSDLTAQGARVELVALPLPFDLPSLPHAFDGLVVAPVWLTHPLTLPADVPAVVLRHTCEPLVAAECGYDVVEIAQEHAGYLAGAHLRAGGHASVGFIGRSHLRGGSGWDVTSAARLRGLELGLGQAVDPAHCFFCNHYDDRSAARLVPQFLQLEDRRPRALFAASDDLALGFILGAEAHGLRVGRDFFIMGFDGQPRARALHDGPLTTIEVPLTEMGRRGVDLLADRLLQRDLPVRHLALGCTLLPGATTCTTSSR